MLLEQKIMNYGYFNKQKINGGNEKWNFDRKLFHV
jgi:hypothetical protein